MCYYVAVFIFFFCIIDIKIWRCKVDECIEQQQKAKLIFFHLVCLDYFKKRIEFSTLLMMFTV